MLWNISRIRVHEYKLDARASDYPPIHLLALPACIDVQTNFGNALAIRRLEFRVELFG